MNLDRLLHPDYTAHPMLDPDFLEKDELAARALYKAFFEMKKDEATTNAVLNRLLRPWSAPHPRVENTALIHSYLREVDLYLRELLRLLPGETAASVAPLAGITETNDFLELLQVACLGSDKRRRFEAQRKIYLAKLFFDVDHTLEVQNGPAHARMLEECLDRELWAHAGRSRRLTIAYTIAPDGLRMEYSIGRPQPGQDSWQVDLRRIRRSAAGKSTLIHVFYYSCRFKRQYRLHHPGGGGDDNVVEEQIWAALQRGRSGSIVSKMIRKGQVDPSKIGDLIGAMFIVKDATEVADLQAMLYDIFGGPLRWREDVDTIFRKDHHERLNEFSAPGYEVKKSLVGVLYSPPDDRPPYLFSVEFQIYTLEGFLRTTHSQHFASHQQLKLRQFLEGLLPYLFPARVYGEETVLACVRG